MKYPFSVSKIRNGNEEFWVARSSVLKAVIGQGDTTEEAVSELEQNEMFWLEDAEEHAEEIPDVPVEPLREYSGKLILRIASYTHEDAARLAKEQGVSLNQYLNDAVVAQNSRMMVQ